MADPEAGTDIVQHRSPATNVSKAAIAGASGYVRASPSKDQHTATTIERRIERNLLIAAEQNVTTHRMGKRVANPIRYQRYAGARSANAGARDAAQIDATEVGQLCKSGREVGAGLFRTDAQ